MKAILTLYMTSNRFYEVYSEDEAIEKRKEIQNYQSDKIFH